MSTKHPLLLPLDWAPSRSLFCEAPWMFPDECEPVESVLAFCSENPIYIPLYVLDALGETFLDGLDPARTRVIVEALDLQEGRAHWLDRLAQGCWSIELWLKDWDETVPPTWPVPMRSNTQVTFCLNHRCEFRILPSWTREFESAQVLFLPATAASQFYFLSCEKSLRALEYVPAELLHSLNVRFPEGQELSSEKNWLNGALIDSLAKQQRVRFWFWYLVAKGRTHNAIRGMAIALHEFLMILFREISRPLRSKEAPR